MQVLQPNTISFLLLREEEKGIEVFVLGSGKKDVGQNIHITVISFIKQLNIQRTGKDFEDR